MMGRSDQEGCWASAASRAPTPSLSASSAMTAPAAPSPMAPASASMLGHTPAWNPACLRALTRSSASRPVGVRSRIRSPRLLGSLASTPTVDGAALVEKRLPFSQVRRNSGQHALEIVQRLTHPDPRIGDLKLADGVLVMAAAFLQHRDGLAHLAEGLEEPDAHQ